MALGKNLRLNDYLFGKDEKVMKIVSEVKDVMTKLFSGEIMGRRKFFERIFDEDIIPKIAARVKIILENEYLLFVTNSTAIIKFISKWGLEKKSDDSIGKMLYLVLTDKKISKIIEEDLLDKLKIEKFDFSAIPIEYDDKALRDVLMTQILKNGSPDKEFMEKLLEDPCLKAEIREMLLLFVND